MMLAQLGAGLRSRVLAAGSSAAHLSSSTTPRRLTAAVTAGVVAVLLVMLGAEVAMPRGVSISAFVFLPVLIAGWLLPPSLAWPVIGAAAGIRLVALLEGPANGLTVAAEVLMIVTIGAIATVAADRFRAWQRAQAEVVRLTARDAIAAEQDRIARQLTDDVVKNLFATTLDLQSAIELVDAERPRVRITKAMDRLDAQITDLRHIVFVRRPDASAISRD